MSQVTSESAKAVPVETLPITKVFVGNLAFRTTDQDLQVLFKDCGEIKAGVIITRGRRSLGYGFIDFVKHEDAVKSVDIMNKKDFSGRPLKVELAKDHFERPDRFERQNDDDGSQPPRRGRRQRNPAPEQDGLHVTPNPAPPATKPAPRAGVAPGGNPVQQKPIKTAPANQGLQTQTQPHDPEAPERKKKRRVRKPRNRANNTEPGAITSQPGTNAPLQHQPTNTDPQKPRAPRTNPNPSVKREKVLSKTTLFVANLPFSVDDDQLALIFKDCNLKSAHVVKTHSGRSRGYGFVVFENEKDQLNAFEKKNGTSVDGTQTTAEGVKQQTRTIAISISSSTTPEGDESNTTTNPQ